MFKTLRRLILCLLALLLVWLLRAFPLRLLGGFLVAEDTPRKADIIVVLSGDSPTRMLGAYDLFKQGYSSRILLSRGSRPRGLEELKAEGLEYPVIADLDRGLLIRMGVAPENCTVLESFVEHTWEEAEITKRSLHDSGVRTLLLVTSRYHSRRARMIFRHVFGDGVEILSVPTRHDGFDPKDWWRERQNWKHALSEYQKLAWYGLVRAGEVIGNLWKAWRLPDEAES